MGWLPLVLVLLGAFVRLRQYAFGRSLWLDEAMLALSVVRRSPSDLLHPLLYGQAAPVGFLWSERVAAVFLGEGERSLRLVPLLAGLAVLPLTWLAARRLLSPALVPLPVALIALNPRLVYYSNEVKQYSTDVAVVLLLLVVGLYLVRRPTTLWAVAAWGALGAVAVWCSHPAVFYLGGTAVALGLQAMVRRNWGRLSVVVAGSAAWSLSFGLEYLVFLREQAGDPKLKNYWASTFPSQPLTLDGLLSWLGSAFYKVFESPVELSATVLMLALSVFGLARLVRRDWTTGCVLGAPLLLLIGSAVAARAYPISGRLALFLVPPLTFLVSLGIDFPGGSAGGRVAAQLRRSWVSRRWPVPVAAATATAVLAGTVAVAVAASSAVGETLAAVRDPFVVSEARPLLERLAAEARPGDAVYVGGNSLPQFRFYSRAIDLPYSGAFAARPMRTCNPVARLAGLAAKPRFWIVILDRTDGGTGDRRGAYLSQFDAVGQRVRSYEAPTQAGLWLYDTTHGPTPDAHPAGLVRGQCIFVV